MVSRLGDLTVICKGGIISDKGTLVQGSALTGSAKELINYESSKKGGYYRTRGYNKLDSTIVPGQGAVLGVKVALNGYFAARKNVAGTAVDIYFSSGSGWTQKNAAGQSNSATKYRSLSYSITKPVVVMLDGQGYAWHYDGTTETLINGSGAPADPKFGEMHLNRLCLSGYGDGSKISISEPNNDVGFTGGGGAVELNVGDTVRGLKRFRDTLYIFCATSIFKLTGTSTTDYAITPVTRSMGCISGDTIQEVGGDLVFLAPDGMRSLAATERLGDINLDSLSSQIQLIMNNLLSKSINEDSLSSCIVASKDLYKLFVYTPTLVRRDSIGISGRRTTGQEGNLYEWSESLGLQAYCSDSGYIGIQEYVIHGDASTGYVYRQDRGTDFDGTPIVYSYKTPDFPFDNAELRKVLHSMTIYSQVEGDIYTELDTLLDFGHADAKQPSTIEISQLGIVDVYGTALYGSSVYSSLEVFKFKARLNGSGFLISFEFSGEDSKPPHRIEGFQIEYALKGRR